LNFRQVIFEIPAEHVPQVGFLQMLHIQTVASSSMTFSTISR